MSQWKAAFALSSSQIHTATPPGTVQIFDVLSDVSQTPKRVPNPSNDPRDPLRLPTLHKAAALIVVSVYAFVANFTSSIIAPALQMWPYAFPGDSRSITELTYLISVHILFLGVANIWWVPLSNWIGRRPVLIAATLLMTTCSVWCGLATSFKSLLAARMFQGIGGAAADTVAPALVGDLYFIHERGRAMAVYTVFLCIGPIVGGISGGYIAFRHGWQDIFWVSVTLASACCIGVIFAVPETLFERPAPEVQQPNCTKTSEGAHAVQIERSATYKPYSYASSINFGPRRGNLLSHFYKPWKTLMLPGTWVVMFHYAGLVGGIITISTIGPQLLAQPPYSWGEHVGLINVGGLIGAILGYLYTTFLADNILQRRAKAVRNGVAEAEDRLPTLFFPLAVSTGGFFVFGFCAQYPSVDRWVGLQAGYAMLSFGLMQVPSVGFNYLIDSYGLLAGDCFTVITILRATISFAWSFFVAEWVEHRGAAEPFGIFGMLMGLFSLTVVPLWLYGKRTRVATASLISEWI